MTGESDCIKAIAEAAKDEHPNSELNPVEHRRQTLSKLEVLRAYYAAWPNAILQGLRKHSRGPLRADLWIIDLFAGKGWHESAEVPGGRTPGTPAMAGFRLWQALSKPEHAGVTAHLVAIDADPAFEAPLHEVLDRFRVLDGLDIRIEVANCASRLADLREESRDGYSLWLFDPYGLRSIPFELLQPLLGNQDRTEALINLDAGGIRRVIDGAMGQQGWNLEHAMVPVLDCLYGDRSWRALPTTLTQTGPRERWLVDRYAGRIREAGNLVESWPLEGGKDYRTLIQFTAHQTAINVFRRNYEQTTKLWKKPRSRATLAEVVVLLRKELANQTLTPNTIHALGALPPEITASRINEACDHAVQLGHAERIRSGVDEAVTFRDVPAAGLFD
jgi:three-Cys-motif partner protein